MILSVEQSGSDFQRFAIIQFCLLDFIYPFKKKLKKDNDKFLLLFCLVCLHIRAVIWLITCDDFALIFFCCERWNRSLDRENPSHSLDTMLDCLYVCLCAFGNHWKGVDLLIHLTLQVHVWVIGVCMKIKSSTHCFWMNSFQIYLYRTLLCGLLFIEVYNLTIFFSFPVINSLVPLLKV